MNIENNPAHASLAHALALRVAAQANAGQVAPPDGSGDPETHPPKTDSPKVNPADAAKAPPVTGVSRNTLSKEVLDQAIRAQEAGAQKVGAQEAGDKPSSGDLEIEGWGFVFNDVSRRRLERIVKDPEYAAKYLADMASSDFLGLINIDNTPQNGAPDSVHRAYSEKLGRQSAALDRISEERRALYDKLVGQGVSSVKIISELTRFTAEAMESVQSSMIEKEAWGQLAKMEHAGHQYLQSLIDRKDATVSVKNGGTA